MKKMEMYEDDVIGFELDTMQDSYNKEIILRYIIGVPLENGFHFSAFIDKAIKGNASSSKNTTINGVSKQSKKGESKRHALQYFDNACYGTDLHQEVFRSLNDIFVRKIQYNSSFPWYFGIANILVGEFDNKNSVDGFINDLSEKAKEYWNKGVFPPIEQLFVETWNE